MSKKNLYKKLLELERENERLREENAYLKFELEELKGKRYKPNNKKLPEDKPSTPGPEKKGGLFGHKGWFRKKPERIDRIEEVKLAECPECGNKVESVLYRKHLYYCKNCQKAVIGKGKGELPGSYIGPVAKAFAVFLKHGIKISDRDIRNMFEKMFNLKIVASSIVGFRDQLKREVLPIYEGLINSLKQGRFIHIDETGAKLDGLPAWRWKFSNKKFCVTHTDESRGQKVVEDILGKEYDGIIISDFLSAYNKIIKKCKRLA